MIWGRCCCVYAEHERPQSQYPPPPMPTAPPPLHLSLHLFLLLQRQWKSVSRRRQRGLLGSSSSPRPSSPYAPQLPFRTPPLQPIHPGKPKKWLFIRILVWYCSAAHKRCFIVLEASPLSQRETITWNCILRVYNKCHFFLSLPLSVLSGGFGHPTQTALALSGQIVVGVAVLHEALEGLGLLWEHGGEICPLGLQ